MFTVCAGGSARTSLTLSRVPSMIITENFLSCIFSQIKYFFLKKNKGIYFTVENMSSLTNLIV